MDYVELVVDISCLSISQQDILLGKLYGFGCDSFQQEKKTLSAFVLKDSFDIELLKSCFVDDECFNLLSINNIKNQNWNAIWESSFKPVYVAGNCCVRAPFHASIHDCEIDIIINPKMSFGTGHHATTLLMMENILLLNLQNKSVLDVGSGTGILSILACKKGASGVVAIDVDSNAYSNSLENIDLNRCDGVDVFQESISDYYHNKQFDFVFANINRNVILGEIDYYIKSLKKGGVLMLSGFLESDFQDIHASVSSFKLKLQSHTNQNDWQCVMYIK